MCFDFDIDWGAETTGYLGHSSCQTLRAVDHVWGIFPSKDSMPPLRQADTGFEGNLMIQMRPYPQRDEYVGDGIPLGQTNQFLNEVIG